VVSPLCVTPHHWGVLVYDADTVIATKDPQPRDGNRITRSYIRVIVIWVVTLAALYAFQEYFA
jgi:hypothetical protein